MKLNEFAKNSLILSVSNFGLLLLGFLYRIVINGFTGAEGLGVYRLLFSIYIVANTFCISGFSMAIATIGAGEFSKCGSTANLLRRCIALFLLFYAGASVFVLCNCDHLSRFISGDITAIPAIRIMLLCLFLTGFENMLKSVFVAVGKVYFTAISEVSEQIVRILAVYILMKLFADGGYGKTAFLIMAAMVISELVSVAFLLFAYHKTFEATEGCGTVSYKRILKIALPVSATALINNSVESANTVILPSRLQVFGLTSDRAMGQIGVISGIVLPVLTLPTAVISSVSSNLVPKINRESRTRLCHTAEKVFEISGLIGIPATCVLLPLGQPIARVFFSQNIPEKIFVLLAAAVIMMYYDMIITGILNGVERQKSIMVNSIVSSVLQLAVTFVFVPKMGIYGYIYAVLGGTFLNLLMNMYSVKTQISIRFSKIVLPSVLCGAAIYLWVRFFYSLIFSAAGRQTTGLIFSIAAAALVYVFIIRALKKKGIILKDG